jgi:transcriptional regulator
MHPHSAFRHDDRALQAQVIDEVGFEMDATAWRPTFKLSQNKAADDRAAVADGLDKAGSPAVAALMRAIAT